MNRLLPRLKKQLNIVDKRVSEMDLRGSIPLKKQLNIVDKSEMECDTPFQHKTY